MKTPEQLAEEIIKPWDITLDHNVKDDIHEITKREVWQMLLQAITQRDAAWENSSLIAKHIEKTVSSLERDRKTADEMLMFYGLRAGPLGGDAYGRN